MQHFYDGQIRRYITQTIRVFSNFVVKYGDGTLKRIPVMYGDPDRQVANIIRGNSENAVSSTPRIAVYVSGLEMDRDRLSDSTFVSKVNIRERDIVNDAYTHTQGKNYTVERLMPTPYKLTMKVDIWSANTDQKLQIIEQLAVLFNPSLELQTNDNFLDWTSLSVLHLIQTNWSSRTIPVGVDSPIDIATLTVETPIWISPPAKVKHLGVITQIITSIFEATPSGSIDGLEPNITFGDQLAVDAVTIGGFNIQVYNGQALLLGPTNNGATVLEVSVPPGSPLNWQTLFDQYPGKYIADSSQLFLTQADGSEVSGTIAINETEPTILAVHWDQSTFPQDDLLQPSDLQGHRLNGMSAGTFDAIIDPTTVYPGHGMVNVVPGDRFLIIEDIGNEINTDGAKGWKGIDGSDLIAHANDIIEYGNDYKWHVLFNASQESNTHLYQSNIYKGIKVQYLWNGVSWVKSFEGDYRAGTWRILL